MSLRPSDGGGHVLSNGKVSLVSIGFISVAVGVGSSAVSCGNASIAWLHDQHEVRNPGLACQVFSRPLYVAFLAVSVVGSSARRALGPPACAQIVRRTRWVRVVRRAHRLRVFPAVAVTG